MKPQQRGRKKYKNGNLQLQSNRPQEALTLLQYEIVPATGLNNANLTHTYHKLTYAFSEHFDCIITQQIFAEYIGKHMADDSHTRRTSR